ncbi:hypothetical protein Zmor_014724 [Zophobas morio]|uniref:DUF4780 domain-containing protein n=1 Tax=Zophobas morio TaxID=2755281 RepID=A0AA38IKR8_9CUCU|nr:hypothetical protein Zmor_014724 [Zophobas morio]
MYIIHLGALDRQLEQCLAARRQATTCRSIKYTEEILRITYEDEVSLEWLKQTVRFLTRLWEGAQLNVVLLAELPRLVRTTLWIPGPLMDVEVVLNPLEGQNQWARVNNLLLFHHEAKPEAVSKGNIFVFDFGMDETKTIRKRAGSTSYMLPSFNLEFKENKASTQEGQTPMEKAETPGEEASIKVGRGRLRHKRGCTNFLVRNVQATT